MTKRDADEFRAFCLSATDRQLQGIYEKEKLAGRTGYVQIALTVAHERAVSIHRLT